MNNTDLAQDKKTAGRAGIVFTERVVHKGKYTHRFKIPSAGAASGLDAVFGRLEKKLVKVAGEDIDFSSKLLHAGKVFCSFSISCNLLPYNKVLTFYTDSLTPCRGREILRYFSLSPAQIKKEISATLERRNQAREKPQYIVSRVERAFCADNIYVRGGGIAVYFAPGEIAEERLGYSTFFFAGRRENS